MTQNEKEPVLEKKNHYKCNTSVDFESVPQPAAPCKRAPKFLWYSFRATQKLAAVFP